MDFNQARDFVYHMSDDDFDITWDCPPGWMRATRRKFIWQCCILNSSGSVQSYLLDHSPYSTLAAVKGAQTRSKRNLGRYICWKLDHIIAIHDKMKSSYFWTPPGNARHRRTFEEVNSNDFRFMWDGKMYELLQTTNCSVKNVYYKCGIFVEDIDCYGLFVQAQRPQTCKNIAAARALVRVVQQYV